MANTTVKGKFNVVAENGDFQTIYPKTTGDQVLVDRSSNASVIPNDVANLQHIINKMGLLALKSKVETSDFTTGTMISSLADLKSNTDTGKIADATVVKDIESRVDTLENSNLVTVDELDAGLATKPDTEINDSVTSTSLTWSSKKLSDQLTTLNSKSSLLNTRVNTLITHNNDTEGNSELIDIRTGYDSISYSSAGEAVRNQVSELHDDINTKNETLTSNINYNKELIDKILIKNLTNDNAVISTRTAGATQTVNENNEYVVTSTSDYGRVDFVIHDNVNVNKNRRFLIISKIHIKNDSVLPISFMPCMYYLKENTPIKNMTGRILSPDIFNTSGNYLVIGVTPSLESFTNTVSGIEYDLHDTTSIQFSLMSKTNGGKFSFKKYSVIDITGWSDDKISWFKLFIEDKLDDYGYFDYIYLPYAIHSTDATHSNSSDTSELSTYATHSNSSDTSELSTYSKYSSYSSFNSFKFNNITNDDIYAFVASIDNFEDNIITVTSNVNYGEIAIKYNFNVDASYIVIWTGYKFNRVDFINKNNGWTPFYNVKSYTINDITYHSCIITPNSNCKLHAVYFGLIDNKTVSFTPISITQVPNNFELSEDLVSTIISDKEYYIPLELSKISSLSNDTNKEYSKYSSYSSFNSFKFNNITNDDIYAFSASIDNFEDNIITVTSNVNYGEIAIKYNFNVDASYIVIWTGYKFNRVDFINKNNNGWIPFYNVKSYTINDITYHSCIITPNSNCKLHAVYFGLIDNKTVSFTPISITQVPTNNFELSEDLVSTIISDKEYYIPLELSKISSLSNDTNKEYSNKWKNKNVLFIGDSLTAANKYQDTIKDILNINIFNHCKGGMGLLQCVDGQTGAGEYDNETYVSGTLYALNTSDVSNKDLIVFYAGYNNRRTNVGVVGDCYDPQNNTGKTIAGYMQYCINRIYEELTEANNLTCKILIVTLDCHGKYPYIDMDGYAEDNGNGTKYISEIQEAVAHANGLACCNLYKNSGINKNTWCVFGASPASEVSTYTKYKINNDGTIDYNTQLNYTTGNYYNQIRNGEVVSEQYNGSSPYPYNGDQLHKSDAGYKRIGECIAGTIIANYGK